MKYRIPAVIVLALFAATSGPAAAQLQHEGTGAAAGPKERTVGLTARLIDAEKKAAHKSATVDVSVRGFKIVDPGSVKEKTADGQGHLHYRLDDGPVIAATATKLGFHGLASGAHTITVTLVGNDHASLGVSEILTVTVP